MAIVITPPQLPPVVVGAVYNQALTATGGTGPYTWSIVPPSSNPGSGALPFWLTFITGTFAATAAVTAGTYYLQVMVVDSLGATAQIGYTLVSGYTLISDVATWVTSDYLSRGDITTIAQNSAIRVYRTITGKVPFDQTTAITQEIPLVTGNDTYDLTQLVPPLLGIIDIRLTINSTIRRRLRRSNARLYDSLSIIQNGLPATYARTTNGQIQLNPPPNSNTYSMRIRYWTRPTEASAFASTVLQTPLEWNELFEWETAYRVLNEIGQEDRAMKLMQPMAMPRQASPKKQPNMEIGIIPRLWNELLLTSSQRENVDEDFSVNPVMRAYSYRD